MRTSECCDIVVAGVGGQGVILLSKIIGKAGSKGGFVCKGCGDAWDGSARW